MVSTTKLLFFSLSSALLFMSTICEATSRSSSLDASSDPMLARYQQWVAQYKRSYNDNAEKEHRFQIFKENAEYIDSVNGNATLSYKLDLNQFADLTADERKAYLGLKLTPSSHATAAKPFRYEEDDTRVPRFLDWRKEGAVTHVKSQGACGDCWAFSATGATEGIVKIKNGNLIALSEQELLDCDHDVDAACYGGYMNEAFKYIIKKGGIASEDSYPYLAENGTCKAGTPIAPGTDIKSFEAVPERNETALKIAVAHQPIAVAVDAGSAGWGFYKSGVLKGDCGLNLNHGVLLVGYGVEHDGTKYWLVKNSWGEEWGDEGYIKIARDVGFPEGECGIALAGSYPTF